MLPQHTQNFSREMAQYLRKHFSIQITHHGWASLDILHCFMLQVLFACKLDSSESPFVGPFSRPPFHKLFCKRREDCKCQLLTVNL